MTEARAEKRQSRALPFVVGLLVGGLAGGIGGYVINDLTSRENPEVMAEIRAEQALQDDLDDFLEALGSQPAPSARPNEGAPTDQAETPSAADD